MRTVLVTLALVIGTFQSLPAANCLCRPGCDGSTAHSPAETRSCCGDDVPVSPPPCACFHRAAPDPASLEVNAPPSIGPAATEAPTLEIDARFHLEIFTPSNSWRADRVRGSPLYLLHSVLLI